jgi:hypothetical protein
VAAYHLTKYDTRYQQNELVLGGRGSRQTLAIGPADFSQNGPFEPVIFLVQSIKKHSLALKYLVNTYGCGPYRSKPRVETGGPGHCIA